MAVELKVPTLGESITEAFIGEWLKSEGDPVEQDEAVVVIETDKATAELPSPVAGTLTHVLKRKGETAAVGEVIGYLEAVGRDRPGSPAEARAPSASAGQGGAGRGNAPRPRREAEGAAGGAELEESRITPSARRAMAEHGLRPEDVTPTGPGGRILKEDVMRSVTGRDGGRSEAGSRAAPTASLVPKPSVAPQETGLREEETVPMSPMRRTIATRLVEAQHTAALLTTFNEIDVSEMMALRRRFGEAFQNRHNVKLGLMSFFVKASIEALKAVPQVNSEIRGDSIVYKNYYDIGIAVSAGKGLVVPVLRSAERLSFAETELRIADFAERARQNRIDLDELRGGTFTISNGGVFGSLLSTPIVNPPQSAILGLHAIQDRPVARDAQVVIRPMMYVALTYDHRVVDGREAVTFLKRVKELIETPSRILLEI
jgi:2-oxoglutarate dehydrogenase E2 component (dihydrolipoamide succinyltransferase)